MSQALHIPDPVVTEEVLRGRHTGQTEVLVSTRAVVTPSGWDYLRAQRLQLKRVEPVSLETRPPAPGSPARPDAGGAIPEVLPPGSQEGLLARGRCDLPDRAFGCRTEEFGSGFVEPATCGGCAVHRLQETGRATCGCGGCNRQRTGGGEGGGVGPTTMEALVQRLTDEIMARLQGR